MGILICQQKGEEIRSLDIPTCARRTVADTQRFTFHFQTFVKTQAEDISWLRHVNVGLFILTCIVLPSLNLIHVWQSSGDVRVFGKTVRNTRDEAFPLLVREAMRNE